METITMILCRGLPGSGKSTLADKLINDLWYNNYNKDIYVAHNEADYFFMIAEQYRYNAVYTKYAHQFCLSKTIRDIFVGKERNIPTLICVANTFTMQKEVDPYIEVAKKFNVQIEIREPQTWWRYDVDECFKRNTHNVPKEVIQKMRDRWEKISL